MLRTLKNEWMDGMRFYVLFNCITVISERWKVDNERLCGMGLRLRLRRFRPRRDRTRSARSVGERLTHLPVATGAPETRKTRPGKNTGLLIFMIIPLKNIKNLAKAVDRFQHCGRTGRQMDRQLR